MGSNILLKLTCSNLEFVLLILIVNLKCINFPYSIFYLKNYKKKSTVLNFSKNVVLFSKIRLICLFFSIFDVPRKRSHELY